VRSIRGDGRSEEVPITLLASVKQFGEPVFPGLRSIERITRSPDRPFHAVINGENFHALQLFTIFGERSIDCLYLDPPYNTGALDWKYNNRFVDKSDGWRHSKWLSFMERRLELGKLLLKPDGVLVIAIDENEHAHLVCLLEQLFVGWSITSVALVHNPRGVQGDNFSHNNEFAVFVTPPGAKVIAKRELSDDAPRERRFRTWGDESKRSTGTAFTLSTFRMRRS
jgi:adenine-specific DNA-methyltransferase